MPCLPHSRPPHPSAFDCRRARPAFDSSLQCNWTVLISMASWVTSAAGVQFTQASSHNMCCSCTVPVPCMPPSVQPFSRSAARGCRCLCSHIAAPPDAFTCASSALLPACHSACPSLHRRATPGTALRQQQLLHFSQVCPQSRHLGLKLRQAGTSLRPAGSLGCAPATTGAGAGAGLALAACSTLVAAFVLVCKTHSGQAACNHAIVRSCAAAPRPAHLSTQLRRSHQAVGKEAVQRSPSSVRSSLSPCLAHRRSSLQRCSQALWFGVACLLDALLLRAAAQLGRAALRCHSTFPGLQLVRTTHKSATIHRIQLLCEANCLQLQNSKALTLRCPACRDRLVARAGRRGRGLETGAPPTCE